MCRYVCVGSTLRGSPREGDTSGSVVMGVSGFLRCFRVLELGGALYYRRKMVLLGMTYSVWRVVLFA